MSGAEELLRDLVAVTRKHTGDGEIPAETAIALSRAARTLVPEQPAEPPPVSEWYRVTWRQTTTLRHSEYVNAADLAELGSDGNTFGPDDPHNVPRSSDAKSMMMLVDSPYAYNLENRLADLEQDDRGDLEEHERDDIDITPVTAEDMQADGFIPMPQRCYPCGALCHWSGAGYVHSEDGIWPRGLAPWLTTEQARGERRAQHMAGQPVQDDDITDSV